MVANTNDSHDALELPEVNHIGSYRQRCAQVCNGGGYIMGFKPSKFVIFNFSTQTILRIPCRHHVYIKQLARLSIFIHADILVLVSEFVVVVVLSE